MKIVATVGWALIACVMMIAARAQAASPEETRSSGGGSCAKNVYNCVDTKNPLPATRTLWIEEMTWMDLRDAIAAGKRTALLASGGVEPNGPWVALGKHDYAMQANCEAIARKLGDALCAPVISYVPSGGPERGVGTLGISPATFEALTGDVAKALREQGFEHIVLLGDHGGANQDVLRKVAAQLNKDWGKPLAVYIEAYYKSWDGADELLLSKGIMKKGDDEGLHDDPNVTFHLMTVNPELVRFEERAKIGKLSINGVSIADRTQDLQYGRMLIDYRAETAAQAIRTAITTLH